MATGMFRILETGLVSALAAFVLIGCGVITRNVDAWEGHTIDQLIESWGAPDSQTNLGQDFGAYMWIGEDGVCEHTFTVQDDTIIGVSDTDCSG